MNLPKEWVEDVFDQNLRRSLKNWAARISPPHTAKTRLLDGATRYANRRRQRTDYFSSTFFSYRYTDFAFRQFAWATSVVLQTGVSIL